MKSHKCLIKDAIADYDQKLNEYSKEIQTIKSLLEKIILLHDDLLKNLDNNENKF